MTHIPKPTQAELAILTVLWKRGPSTVRHVFEALEEEQGIGYTTVLKFLQIMLKKGLVTRDSSSMAHVYEAAISESDTQQNLVKELINGAFRGSAKNLVLSALAMDASTPEELEEIKKLIDKLEGKS